MSRHAAAARRGCVGFLLFVAGLCFAGGAYGVSQKLWIEAGACAAGCVGFVAAAMRAALGGEL